MRKHMRVRRGMMWTNFSGLEGDGEEVDSRRSLATLWSSSSWLERSEEAEKESLRFGSSEVGASSLVTATAAPPWLWSFETGEPSDCLCML